MLEETIAGDEPRLKDDFRVGAWLVQPRLGRVTCDEKSVKVEPKIMRVLVCLAERQGETVTREELMGEVWSDAFVGEDALNRSISKLRAIFEDDPRRPAVIETIPKIGYRIIAPVSTPGEATEEKDETIKIVGPVPPAPARRSRRLRVLFAVFIAAGAGVALWLGLKASLNSTPRPPRIVPLTSYPGHELAPSFSPDGQQVVFAWNGGSGRVFNLYVKSVSGERLTRLTETGATDGQPAWSPDGKSVAFIRLLPEECGLYLVPATGGEARRLTSCGMREALALVWSPDGEWLAFPDRNAAGEPYAIHLFSLKTGERRKLTSPPAGFFGDNDLAIAPHGRTLAFGRMSALGAEDVYLVPFAGGEEKRLTFDHLKVSGLAWSADGARIIYASNRGGNYGLWQVSPQGGAPSWLGLGGTNVYAPAVSKTGGRLAFEQGTSDTNIWQLNPGATSAPRRLIASTQWDWSPQFSPDGKRIAFLSDRSGSSEVWVSAADGSEPVQMTSFGGPYVTTPRWSPDGRTIAFDVRLREHSDIYTISADGGTPRPFAAEAFDEAAPSWSRDGRWIYYAANAVDSWQVWKRPAGGGEAVRVTQSGGFAALESADGRTLYYTRREAAGLWQVPAGGGPEREALASLQPVDWNNWALTADGIYYVERRVDEEPAIFFRHFTTGEARKIAVLNRLLYKSGLAVAPDGLTLLYANIDRSESDLVIAENVFPR